MAPRRRDDKRDPSVVLLEYIAGLLTLPRDADEATKVALAANVELPVETAARVLGKSNAAAQKALERARKQTKKR